MLGFPPDGSGRMPAGAAWAASVEHSAGRRRLKVKERIMSGLERLQGTDTWVKPFPFPKLTPREASTAPLEEKSRAIIGMRRAGKTTFLYQCLAARLADGVPRNRLMYFNFEDERLGEMEAVDLGMILDEYYRSHPESRRTERVTWCFDEIQGIPGWEKFIRRVMDSENVEILLSGSSSITKTASPSAYRTWT